MVRQKLIDFSRFSAIKVGTTQSVSVIETCVPTPDVYMIGKANNMIIGEEAPALALLGKSFDYIYHEGDALRIGAATPSGKIVSFCKKHNLGALEFLSHLPGSLGGLVAMNAGLKSYELFNQLQRIVTAEGAINAADIAHGYRFATLPSAVFEATLTITSGFNATAVEQFAAMRANQPKAPSAGSFFKNPSNDYAGRLIESVGLKGVEYGGMAWSEQHANFLINTGKGRVDDAIWLVNEAKRRVFETHGVKLHDEVQLLDARYDALQGYER